ncbi:MAG: hypothetical protein ABEI74_04375 [Candidatus Pacearchaeota archaeon]
METVEVPKEEYEQMKRKSKIADDAIVQLQLSLEDLKNKKVERFD